MAPGIGGTGLLSARAEIAEIFGLDIPLIRAYIPGIV